MDDIYFSMPVACGERDCAAQWHVMHIWRYDDGTWSQCDADGNHDPLEAADVPTLEEHDAAWLAYSRHVAATGEDPLRNYMVPRETTRRERWAFYIGPSIAGPVVVRARRGGRAFAGEYPPHVMEYLDMFPGTRRLRASAEDLAVVGIAVGAWHDVELKHKAPRPAARVAAETRAAARRHIRQSQKSP
jgi:hypothetical protein